MYLTKITLSLADRSIQRALGDCQQMHRLIMGLFDTDRASANVLYRLRSAQGAIAVYIYSSAPLKSDRLTLGMKFAGERDMGPWLESLSEGQRWNFDLLACPSKKVAVEGIKNSRRRILRTPDERTDWLRHKAMQNGFAVMTVRELGSSQQTGHHPAENGGRLYIDNYHYQGTLQVTDAALFRNVVSSGLGPGKAYGLGMLLLTH